MQRRLAHEETSRPLAIPSHVPKSCVGPTLSPERMLLRLGRFFTRHRTALGIA